MKRCAWVPDNDPLYQDYHDKEWGVPVFDDQKLFEMLTLEGAQAGLSWSTVLKKREGYREAFHQFQIEKVASMSDSELEKLQKNPEIIRNKLKISSTRDNAQAIRRLQKEYGSFSDYLWNFVKQQPLQNSWKQLSEVPAETDLSKNISKDLKKRGFRFVGPTIIYAYMQAIGMVNDHTTDCYRYEEIRACSSSKNHSGTK